MREYVKQKHIGIIIALLISFFITLINLKLYYKCAVVLVLFFLVFLKTQRGSAYHKLGYGSFVMILLVAFLCSLQAVILGSSTIIGSVTINCALFFPLGILFLLSGLFESIDIIVLSFGIFDVLFSIYYLTAIVFIGLPEERNSVLGYVSSNYCAAVLYLTIPLILYYLRTHTVKKNKQLLLYAALMLSALMILTSGSRTAFAVVMVLYFSLLILPEKRLSVKGRQLCMLFGVLVAAVIAYYEIPSIRALINRAMIALQGLQNGNNEVDVRVHLWRKGLNDFKGYNHIVGSASNLITVFDFTQPGHNLFIELLIADGVLGVIEYSLMVGMYGLFVFHKTNKIQKFFLFQVFALYALVAFVQPFFSTNITCAIIIWLTAFGIKLNPGGNYESARISYNTSLQR